MARSTGRMPVGSTRYHHGAVQFGPYQVRRDRVQWSTGVSTGQDRSALVQFRGHRGPSRTVLPGASQADSAGSIPVTRSTQDHWPADPRTHAMSGFRSPAPRKDAGGCGTTARTGCADRRELPDHGGLRGSPRPAAHGAGHRHLAPAGHRRFVHCLGLCGSVPGTAKRAESLSPRTITVYRRQLDRLYLPDPGDIELGRIPIGKLLRESVAAWEAEARAVARAAARAWALALGLPVPATGRVSPRGARPPADHRSGHPRPRPAVASTHSSNGWAYTLLTSAGTGAPPRSRRGARPARQHCPGSR